MAIWRSVASWKITYAGTPCSFALAARQARSRSKTAAADGGSSATTVAAPRGFADRAGRSGSRRSMTERRRPSTSALVSVRTRVP